MQSETPATPEGKTGILIPLPPPKIRLGSIREIRREFARLYADARAGRVPASDAARLAFILDRIRACIADHEFEARIVALEERQHGKRA